MTEEKIIIDTYKSYWEQDILSGNYKRIQKSVYPLEKFLPAFLSKIPKFRYLYRMLGKKEQGVDYYKYYTEIIKSGNRGKWASEITPINERLSSRQINLANKDILDISGEPGFFGEDVKKVANRVVVTAFAEEVAEAIKDVLGLESAKYDFNSDKLSSLFETQSFDIIFVRYAIGFCENIEFFFDECFKITKNDGYMYVSFSPASRGVCARWMFDDYTYLRQYTKKYIVDMAKNAGFNLVCEYDDGSYSWDYNMHPVQKLISSFYTSKIFKGASPEEYKQYNVAFLFKKS